MWIDKKGGLRSKTKVENFAKEPTLHDCKEWNFDGSSTGQAVANDSEVLLKPVAICKDPFRGGTSKLVLCETWLDDKDPHPTNTRWKAEKIFSMAGDKKPMFGLEQEFFFSKDVENYSVSRNNRGGMGHGGDGQSLSKEFGWGGT